MFGLLNKPKPVPVAVEYDVTINYFGDITEGLRKCRRHYVVMGTLENFREMKKSGRKVLPFDRREPEAQ